LLFTLPLDVGLELDWLAICDSFVVLGIVNGSQRIILNAQGIKCCYWKIKHKIYSS